VDGRSLDYSKMEEQKGDEEVVGFSYLDIEKVKPENQRSCHITYTDARVHEMLKTGFDRSPMYQGRIEGVGPRYCPSIEDKINRFAERERHQLFVEPEGWNTVEIYVNGFSTSLPEEVQYEALRMVPGFEKARMFRPGYAIEYDYFQPTQLTYTLETKALENLYFAGQINGTTGYEEAACQGIMAGMNAHLKINNQPPLILQRSEAYIGVLIDDLISKGTEEPYRMFTSRAEFRTLLRQDNADLRLTEMSYKLGLAKEVRMRRVEEKTKQVTEIKNVLDTESIAPEIINAFLTDIDSATISEKQKASKLLLRPNISLQQILSNNELLRDKMNAFDTECLEQAEIQIKYERYIEKEKEIVERMATLENKLIPTNFDYDKIAAISIEARQKFKKIRPLTLGQASRISGVNPSDVQILMVFMGR
jgi:tRNA uridine 5-carboxymethylaminomethyl modification enzyme